MNGETKTRLNPKFIRIPAGSLFSVAQTLRSPSSVLLPQSSTAFLAPFSLDLQIQRAKGVQHFQIIYVMLSATDRIFSFGKIF